MIGARFTHLMAFFCVALVLLVACDAQPNDDRIVGGGSETGSLGLTCEASEECGPLQCVSGVCGEPCTVTDDCAAASLDTAVCTEACLGDDCSPRDPVESVCLAPCATDADCGDLERLVCNDGACIDRTFEQCSSNQDCAFLGPMAGCFEGICEPVRCAVDDIEIGVFDFESEEPLIGTVCMNVTECNDEPICAATDDLGDATLTVPIVNQAEFVFEADGYVTSSVVAPLFTITEVGDFELFPTGSLETFIVDETGVEPDFEERGMVVVFTARGPIDVDLTAEGIEVEPQEEADATVLYTDMNGFLNESLDRTSEDGVALIYDALPGEWDIDGFPADPLAICAPRLAPPGNGPDTVRVEVTAGEVRIVSMVCQ